MAERGKKPWEDKVLRSGFLVGAVLLHLIVFALIAACIVFPPGAVPPPDPMRVAVQAPPATTNPPLPPVGPSNPVVSTAGAPIAPITGGAPVSVDVRMPVDQPNPGALPISITPKTIDAAPTHGLPEARAAAIGQFEGTHRTAADIRNHDPAGDYPIFVASYADGDWGCNVSLDAHGQIVAGSISNLMAKITEWSHGQIRGHLVPRPLEIAGPELLAQKPPFIFFTGHKDFVLTDREIANLQEYLYEGGAIWGDNALAGRGSRFDVAFHREMRRVVGASGDFQTVASGDDLFKAHFQLEQAPEGMNYFAEPIQRLDIDGKVAILYTPDDYSDLFTMRILPGDTSIGPVLSTPDQPLVTSGLFLFNRGIYFRNFTLPSSLAAHRLGMNIMTYLITRFDDNLLLSP